MRKGSKKKRTKLQAEAVHAKRRAYERYALELSKYDLGQAVNDIRCGKSTNHRRISNRLSRHTLTICGKSCRVIYDRMRKQIVTFLPARGS